MRSRSRPPHPISALLSRPSEAARPRNKPAHLRRVTPISTNELGGDFTDIMWRRRPGRPLHTRGGCATVRSTGGPLPHLPPPASAHGNQAQCSPGTTPRFWHATRDSSRQHPQKNARLARRCGARPWQAARLRQTRTCWPTGAGQCRLLPLPGVDGGGLAGPQAPPLGQPKPLPALQLRLFRRTETSAGSLTLLNESPRTSDNIRAYLPISGRP